MVEDVIVAPRDSLARGIKSAGDRLVAALLILGLSPLLLLIVVAIKATSRGPALFKQTRHGVNRSLFTVYKFRTFANSKADVAGAEQIKRVDPRVTRVGSLLRKTSLDELPQLFNVLKGDMSLIGPRPHPVPLDQEYEKLIEGYAVRYRVKPGITGWAQVNGHRGPVYAVETMQGRVDHDSYYIENWSLLLDIKIFLMTLYKGFFHENAY